MTVVDTLPSLSSPYPVSDEHRAGFSRDGHVVLRGVASAEEVGAYRTAIKAGEARFVLGARFAGLAAALLGVEAVRLYHDQALFKEPGGGPTPWHQDGCYWPLDTNLTITMWMPLVDVPAGMEWVSGSHQQGDLGRFEIPDASEAHFRSVIAARELPVAAAGPLAAGDATFHAGWALHRAPGNDTDVMREVMTVIWFADGTRVGAADSPLRQNDLRQWLPGLQPGDLAASPLNPRLP